MPAVLGTAGPGISDESAPASLKGSRAGRLFWVSLTTRDEVEARSRIRRLDGEAGALSLSSGISAKAIVGNIPIVSNLNSSVI